MSPGSGGSQAGGGGGGVQGRVPRAHRPEVVPLAVLGHAHVVARPVLLLQHHLHAASGPGSAAAACMQVSWGMWPPPPRTRLPLGQPPHQLDQRLYR